MDFVEQLKSAVDIVSVVGEYVRLRKAGTRWVGLCPFHTEKTPSFGVHGAHQFYKCFGCGAGGDVLKFVMEIEGVTFYEALKLLSERYGIPMPKRREENDPESRVREACYRAQEIAASLFRANLYGAAGAAARDYLRRRGVGEELAQEFGLGFAERGGTALLKRLQAEGFSPEQMEQSGLVLRRHDGSGFYDRFRGRLMFPIHNESGKVIGFGGRALASEDEPKYLNSPESPIYHKSNVLYNLHRAKQSARKSDCIVLVEGYMDVIGVYAAGLREVVASCGTSLTHAQVRSMKRHGSRVVVNFDPDAAGASAAERSIDLLLEEGMHVRVLQLQGGLDPDEFVKANGAEAYRQALDNADPYFYWLADRARTKFDVRSADGRMEAFQFLLPAIQRLSDKLERVAVANDVAGYLGVEPGLILEQFRKAALNRRNRAETSPAVIAAQIPPMEKMLLNALLSSADARVRILPRLKTMPAVSHFQSRRIFQGLFELAEERPDMTFGELERMLEESDKALLASMAFADELGEQAFSIEQAEACLRRLEAQDQAMSASELQSRIRTAERAGNLDEALRLAAELERVRRARVRGAG